VEIDPELLDSSTRYKLLIGSVVPRPIAFVSSLSPEGVATLAPFLYFNAAGHRPLALMFSISLKPNGSEKDTLRNVRPPAASFSRPAWPSRPWPLSAARCKLCRWASFTL
jgi:hypothetical protein